MSCRFMILTDTHFLYPPHEYGRAWWNRSTERYSGFMGEMLVRLARELAPDFAVHCGDFTAEGSRANYDFGSGFMDRFGCPWYFVPGNHDTWFPDTRDCLREAFCRDRESGSYRRDRGGLRLIFLETVTWFSRGGGRFPCFDREKYRSGEFIGMGTPERDLVWLERELRESGVPAVIISHAPLDYRDTYPLATLPGGRPVAAPRTAPSAFVHDILKREEILRIIHGNPALKACFAGHWHLHDALVRDGILFVQTAALREYPYEVRMVDFDGDSLQVTTHALDVPRLREMSFVGEWGNRWVEGTDAVRNFGFRFGDGGERKNNGQLPPSPVPAHSPPPAK